MSDKDKDRAARDKAQWEAEQEYKENIGKLAEKAKAILKDAEEAKK